MNAKIISDSKSGVLEFSILEKQERGFGNIGMEFPINEAFENKIGKPAAGYYAYVSKARFRHADLQRTLLNWNTKVVDTIITINYVFNTEEIEQRLLEIRQETEEICKIDNEVDMVHEQAYSDIRLLLEIINKTNPRIPMPDLDSADDGSLNATWFHKKNVITMGVYGNDNVIFTLYFKEKRQVSGFCELSDEPVLNGFFQTLYDILNE